MSSEKIKPYTGVKLSYLMAMAKIQRVGKEHGYNITVHGSLERDCDIVAVPWQEQASSAEDLAIAICTEIDGFFSPSDMEHEGGLPYKRAHGRLCYPIHLGRGPYIDLSIMLRQQDWK